MHACSPLVDLPFTLSCDAEVPASAFPAPDDSRTCLMMISQGGQSYNLAARKSQDSHNLGRIKLSFVVQNCAVFGYYTNTWLPGGPVFHGQIDVAAGPANQREPNS